MAVEIFSLRSCTFVNVCFTIIGNIQVPPNANLSCFCSYFVQIKKFVLLYQPKQLDLDIFAPTIPVHISFKNNTFLFQVNYLELNISWNQKLLDLTKKHLGIKKSSSTLTFNRIKIMDSGTIEIYVVGVSTS